MTSADPFTRASPHYVAAMRTCDKTGDAFEVTGGASIAWDRVGFIVACAAVWGLILFGFSRCG